MPYIIFKAQRAKPGLLHGNRGSVTYEIYHNKPDQWGNHYPPKNKLFVSVNPSASSNGELTIEYLKNVFFPEVGAVDGELQHAAGLVLDAFSGHHKQEVKDYTGKHDQLKWLLMDGGITPKCQPLDVLINKIFKGFFRDLFEEWSLQAPMKADGHPYAPSRQLLSQWVVQAWEKVPVELIKKSWDVCSYKSMGQLEEEMSSTALVEYNSAA